MLIRTPARVSHPGSGSITPAMVHSATTPSQRRASLIAILATMAGAAVLLRFSPTQYGLYPKCPIHQYFGILCPGCGTTRALAALLHGHLIEALHFNPLTTLLLPVGLAWIVYSRRRQGPLQLPPVALYTLLGITAIFTLARNL